MLWADPDFGLQSKQFFAFVRRVRNQRGFSHHVDHHQASSGFGLGFAVPDLLKHPHSERKAHDAVTFQRRSNINHAIED